MNKVLSFISGTLAAVSGICFIGGIAVLTGGRS
jgi:hypothetical protein